MEKNFEIQSFLNQDEVEILLDFYNVLPRHLNSGSDKKAYTSGFDINDIPVENFLDRLKNVLGDFKISTTLILEEFIPWTVHTDYLPPDNSPYYSVLIPLDYRDKKTHTIIFKELGLEKDWQKKLTEDTNYPYSNKEKKLLGHVDDHLLSKLTIDKIYNWKRGNLIAWHRNLLHSSDDFLANGLDRKIALTMFLNND